LIVTLHLLLTRARWQNEKFINCPIIHIKLSTQLKKKLKQINSFETVLKLFFFLVLFQFRFNCADTFWAHSEKSRCPFEGPKTELFTYLIL